VALSFSAGRLKRTIPRNGARASAPRYAAATVARRIYDCFCGLIRAIGKTFAAENVVIAEGGFFVFFFVFFRRVGKHARPLTRKAPANLEY